MVSVTAYQEMVYCSSSTSHVKQQTIVLLFFVALRDFGRSARKGSCLIAELLAQVSLSKKLIM